jgi:hypothetical protein
MKTYSRHDFTREERAARAKVAISAAFESKEQAFLDFVLSHYVRVGVQEQISKEGRKRPRAPLFVARDRRWRATGEITVSVVGFKNPNWFDTHQIPKNAAYAIPDEAAPG